MECYVMMGCCCTRCKEQAWAGLLEEVGPCEERRGGWQEGEMQTEEGRGAPKFCHYTSTLVLLDLASLVHIKSLWGAQDGGHMGKQGGLQSVDGLL